MSKIELANRLDNLMHDIDFYNYNDCEYNNEKSLNDLINNPYEIITALVEIIEILTD